MGDEIIIDGLDDDFELDNTQIDDLMTEDINLMFLGIDQSASMSQYVDVMENELQKFKDSISNSKESDKILVSRVNFSTKVHFGTKGKTGYVKIEDFDVNYTLENSTALYDTIVKGGEKTLEYFEELRSEGMRPKIVFSIFSDGFDNVSKKTLQDAKRVIEDFNRREFVTVFVAFGVDALLEARNLGFKNIHESGQSESELRHAFNQLSKSMISQSKSQVAKTDDFFEI